MRRPSSKVGVIRTEGGAKAPLFFAFKITTLNSLNLEPQRSQRTQRVLWCVGTLAAIDLVALAMTTPLASPLSSLCPL
jgi:hypothetical protein